MRKLNVILIVLIALAVTKCSFLGMGGSADEDPNPPQGPVGPSGHNSLIMMVPGAPSCVAGGTTILSGLDSDDSGVLEASEVQFSQPICNGVDGATGATGAGGHNAVVALIDSSEGGGPTCTNGGITVLAGTDWDDSGELEAVEVDYSKDVCNGTNGLNAPPTPYTPVGLEDPCGDAPGIYDEVFIRMANNQLVASFSQNASGLNTRFSVLTAGNYVTTDGDNCTFTVDSGNNIINENHHY